MIPLTLRLNSAMRSDGRRLVLIRRFLTIPAASAALALTAPATAASAPWEGVWDGTVGELPVRACFDRHGDRAHGAYYYLSRLQAIMLASMEGQAKTFVEGVREEPTSPRWVFADMSAGELSGRWTQGSRTLPIHLRRTARGTGDEGPCSSLIFHRPRLQDVRIVEKPAEKYGVPYRRLILDHRGHFPEVSVETFQLAGNSPEIQRINAKLHEPLSGEASEWFACIRSAVGWGIDEGDWSESLEPKMIGKRWMTVEHLAGGNCGGAHPNADVMPRTFDLASGREIDLHDWLTDQAVKRERFQGVSEEAKMLRPVFTRFIIGAWKSSDADCDEVIRQAEFWHIGMTRTALVFTPELPHVAQGCADDFTVPFARLASYLSPAGKAGIASVIADAVK
jgi:hypothetical protein